MLRLCLIALLALVGVLTAERRAAGQSVAIAPQVLVLDARSRTASLVLVNQDGAPADVTLSFFYAYPETDADGAMRLRTFTSVEDTMPSAASWIRSYPDRLVLQPYERRAVRLLASPPPDLATREFWTRLMVSVRGRRVAVEGIGESSGISVGLDLEVRSVLGVFYRPTGLSTGLALGDLRTVVERDSLIVRARLTRRGNAAFVGSLTAVLRDERQKLRASATLPLGVYYELDPRIALPVSGLPPGRYELVVEAVTTRPDLPSRSLLQAAPIRVQRSLTL